MGVTGYEVKAYADLTRIADNLGRIAESLEAIATAATRDQQLYEVARQVTEEAFGPGSYQDPRPGERFLDALAERVANHERLHARWQEERQT